MSWFVNSVSTHSPEILRKFATAEKKSFGILKTATLYSIFSFHYFLSFHYRFSDLGHGVSLKKKKSNERERMIG